MTDKKDSKLNLPLLVLIGAVGGIATGIFAGDYARLLEPLGTAYVQLVAMAVFPYLIASLLHGLGKLDTSTARKLFSRSWYIFVFAWMGVFTGLFLISLAFPAPSHPALITPQSTNGSIDLVSILIPGNPFADLSKNYVPAVVVFAFLYGVAMQKIKNKETYLQLLEYVKTASTTIWSWVVMVAPLGVFALFASTSGTLAPHELRSLSLYILVFMVGAFLMAFLILPLIMSAIVPVSYRELMQSLRGGFILSMVTTLSVAALPSITETCEKIARKVVTETEGLSEIVGTNISVSYPFAQLGNLFVALFFTFCAFYYQAPIQTAGMAMLPLLTLLSTIGSPSATVDAVNLLSSIYQMPAGAENLYVATMAVTRYGQVALSVMGFAFVSILSTLSFYGKLKVHPGKLAAYLLLGLLLMGGTGIGLSALGHHCFPGRETAYLHFRIDDELTKRINVKVNREAPTTWESLVPGENTMQRVRRTGVLKVGYEPGIIPFCYWNENNELVGYDVAFMYKLASDMNVRLEFIPFRFSELIGELKARHFDLAIGGLFVNQERLLDLSVSKPYMQAPVTLIARSPLASHLTSRDRIASQQLHIACLDSPVLIPLASRVLPGQQITVVKDYECMLNDSRFDAALWSLYQAKAFATAHPGFTAVVPDDMGSPLLIAYMMPQESGQLVRYMDYWLDLKSTEGFAERQKKLWIDGVPQQQHFPRWSVLRNVLHWVK